MRILLRRVDDFENAVVEWICVETCRFSDNSFPDLVEVAVGICRGVLRDGMGFFVGYGVFVTIDCGVDTYCCCQK
jgi:hypothetical protein